MCVETIVNGIIRLDQFLKWAGVVGTGGMAKALIQDGEVKVNGYPETRRGKKLNNGDVVQVFDESSYKVIIKE